MSTFQTSSDDQLFLDSSVYISGNLFIKNNQVNLDNISMGPIGPTGALGHIGPTGATGPAGANGLSGMAGQLGTPGRTGATGPTGNTGAIGPTGSLGATGAVGQSVKIIGSTGTSSSLPTGYSGNIGDGQIVTDTGNLWVWGGSTWSNVGKIVGPTGATSTITGPTGATSTITGPTGPTGLSVTGNLVITDQTISGNDLNGNIIITPNGTGLLVISGNLLVQQPTSTLYSSTSPNVIAQFQNIDQLSTTVLLDTYSDSLGNGFGAISFRRFGGNSISPTAVVSGQVLGSFIAQGFTGDTFISNSQSGITIRALENFSDTNLGSQLQFYTVPVGSNVSTLSATISNNSLIVGNVVITNNALSLASNNATLYLSNVGQNVSILSTNTAISTTTGALTVSGGVGIAGNVFAKSITLSAGTASQYPLKFTQASTLLNPSQSGEMNYDGTVFYATPLGTQRGVISTEQNYILNVPYSFTPGNGSPTSLFGISPNVTANVRYRFNISASVIHDTNNGTMNFSFGGGSSISKVLYKADTVIGQQGVSGNSISVLSNSVTSTTLFSSNANAGVSVSFVINGMVDIGSTGGTLTPQIGWSITPGLVTVGYLSGMYIYPIGTTTGNTVVGNWS